MSSCLMFSLLLIGIAIALHAGDCVGCFAIVWCVVVVNEDDS